LPHPKSALVAAIGEAVQDAVGRGPDGTRAPPSAVAPEAVARALTEALDPVARTDPRPPEAIGGAPVPRPEAQAPLSTTAPPAPCRARGRHPRLLDRLAALWRVAGRATSHHAAERLLLRTALAELGTFDEALRRVVQRSGGYEARFAGMTEDQAERACARLGARNIPCETFGP
jgi:D-alanyl-D-alanine carboxypeptidase